MKTPRVGFIGLGSQGGPMARRITEEGFPLTIWARRRASLEAFGDTGATIAASPAEVGSASDVVGICVVTDADVEDILLRADGVLAGMAPDGIVAIHSTIHPDTCRRLADAAATRGVGVIDAPVSGGGLAAAERRLLIMAGGSVEALQRCRPVFDAFADPIIHLGDIGSGQVAKVLNNFVFTAHAAVALDAFAFADGLAVEREALAAVLAHGSGGSSAGAILAASGFDTEGLKGALPLLRKDIDIALDVARAADAQLPDVLTNAAEAALRMLAEPAEDR